MRDRVHAETGLTCSCGVAPNRMLAKVCSDVNKPNGQCVISSDPTEIRRFVDALPIRKVPGIGKVGFPWFYGLLVPLLLGSGNIEKNA